MWTSVSPCPVRCLCVVKRWFVYKHFAFHWLKTERAGGEGLTLVHFSAHREHFLGDTPGSFSASVTENVSG